MKNSVLASLLFGAMAVAAPMNKRDLVIKTEVLTQTVVIYTTVWDDAVAEATTTPAGYFYEQPQSSSVVITSSAQPVQSSAPAPASSAYVAPPAPQAQSPSPAPAPTPSPAAQQPAAQSPQAVEQPAQPTTSAYVAPAAASPAPAPTTQAASPAPAASPSPAAAAPANNGGSSGDSSGATYQNVDMTIYDNNGGFGACGTELHDSDMIVALAKDAWGASTYDVMTGAATNPWCGQKINIEYNGNSIQATIMDLCPGCSGHDIDLSLAAWTKLTGMTEKTRLKASWSKA